MSDKAGIQWRKSSYSTGEGTADECVEVGWLPWRKSSFSTGDGSGNECVEVGWLLSTAALLRDSKSPENGHLHIPASAFAAFMTSIKAS
jgi:hypothetical protein